MRTQELRRARARRTSIAVLVASVVALSAFAGLASAKTPNWSMDPVVSLPASVTPGAAAGYEVTIRNGGPSNISQLYLTAYLGGTSNAAPNPVFTSTTAGSCPNTGGTLFCSLGQLKAGKSVTVTVAFATPASASSFSIRFEANTTGATSSDGGTSHGDTIEQTGTTALSNDADFAGGFVIGNTVVANSQALSSGNPQSTKVHAPTSNIPVTVADGDNVTPVVCPIACWSETSEIHVDRGNAHGIFKVEIGIHKSIKKTVHGVYHEFDAGHVPAAEDITAECPKHGTPTSPCFSVSKLSGGNILVTVWLLENGKGGLY